MPPAPPAPPKVDTRPSQQDVKAATSGRPPPPSFIDDGLNALAGRPAPRAKAVAARAEAPANTRPGQKEVHFGGDDSPIQGEGPRYAEPPMTAQEAMQTGPETGVGEMQAAKEGQTPPGPDPMAVPVGEMPSSLEELERLAGVAQAKEKPAAKAEDAPAKDETLATSDEPTDADIDRQAESHKTLPEVRNAHKAQLKLNRQLKRDLEARAAELKALSEKVQALETGEGSPLVEQVESAKVRIAEYEDRIRSLDYTQSAEFKEKYVQPLAKALEMAYADVQELAVTEGEGQRAATADDFKRLVGLDPATAKARAKEMFGDGAAEIVFDHYKAVRAQDRLRREGLANADKLSAEAVRNQAAQAEAQQREFKSAYERASEEFADRLPDLFKARDGDDEGNALLSKGRAMIQQALEGAAKMSPVERAQTAAQIHMRAAAYGRALLDLKRAREENETLKAQLEEFQVSEPKGADTGGNGKAPASVDPEDPNYDPFKAIEALGR